MNTKYDIYLWYNTSKKEDLELAKKIEYSLNHWGYTKVYADYKKDDSLVKHEDIVLYIYIAKEEDESSIQAFNEMKPKSSNTIYITKGFRIKESVSGGSKCFDITIDTYSEDLYQEIESIFWDDSNIYLKEYPISNVYQAPSTAFRTNCTELLKKKKYEEAISLSSKELTHNKESKYPYLFMFMAQNETDNILECLKDSKSITKGIRYLEEAYAYMEKEKRDELLDIIYLRLKTIDDPDLLVFYMERRRNAEELKRILSSKITKKIYSNIYLLTNTLLHINEDDYSVYFACYLIKKEYSTYNELLKDDAFLENKEIMNAIHSYEACHPDAKDNPFVKLNKALSMQKEKENTDSNGYEIDINHISNPFYEDKDDFDQLSSFRLLTKLTSITVFFASFIFFILGRTYSISYEAGTIIMILLAASPTAFVGITSFMRRGKEQVLTSYSKYIYLIPQAVALFLATYYLGNIHSDLMILFEISLVGFSIIFIVLSLMYFYKDSIMDSLFFMLFSAICALTNLIQPHVSFSVYVDAFDVLQLISYCIVPIAFVLSPIINHIRVKKYGKAALVASLYSVLLVILLISFLIVSIILLHSLKIEVQYYYIVHGLITVSIVIHSVLSVIMNKLNKKAM